ncbi:LAETG motif-containing sortase-dependent surface protein [Kitasatospora sp. NPDC058063]|uniref:LAETG motif-containing sortase-dependent surface protein n=1 Tax=unclassified Kitasatospora TaxID=2633591 RepID=UPI0036D87B2E
MRKTNRALNRARRLVPAVALTAALVAGGAVTATPAFATAGPLGLTVHAPAVVGFAGGPVEFTEHIGNPGDQGTSVVLDFEIESDLGTPPNALSLDYFSDTTGGWLPVDLRARSEGNRMVNAGGTGKVAVPAGGTDVRLRLGVPMGKPHDGATNGGTGPNLAFRTTVKGWWQDSPVEPPLNDTHVINVEGITNGVSGVPATAVAGGAPIEFDAVLRNPTPSAYTNLGNVLFTDRHARVEVRGADGTWTVLAPVTTEAEPPAGFYLDGRNSSAAPGSSQTKRVRVSYPADMPPGATELNPCVFVNEGDGMPFRGTTMCSPGATVRVVAPEPKPTTTPAPTGTPESTGTPAPTPSTGSNGSNGSKPQPGGDAPAAQQAGDVTRAPAAPAASVPAGPAGDAPAAGDRPAGGHLASTGADSDRTGLIAGAGALLVGAGAGAFFLARRRRTS